MLEDNDVRLHSNEDTIRAADKISMFKTIVEHLISQLGQASPSRQQCEDSNIISCPDCQTYETSLQKLEN